MVWSSGTKQTHPDPESEDSHLERGVSDKDQEGTRNHLQVQVHQVTDWMFDGSLLWWLSWGGVGVGPKGMGFKGA